ncbi:MAG: hypothetical protein KatS3mg015_3168 [Fimbriimonadales bacterium]|nr:MAG: hypothetical protein KatS3mg015_3168 [Fimbriimonadales bacterium]
MKARSRGLLDRAVAAMVAAIEIYNKPDTSYRAESFAILATNAWELLLKAKWLAEHKNRISCLYVRQGGGTKRKRIKKTAAGNPMTHSLDYLASKLREQGALNEQAYRNLTVLSEFRDSAVHFYHQNPQFAERLQEIGAAAVKNFSSAAREWFKAELSRYNFYLLPLAFVSPPRSAEGVILSSEEKRFLKFVNGLSQDDHDPASPYSVAVNVEVRFVKSKSAAAAPVRVTADPTAPAVRLTEEQIRERYPWDYAELTRRCQERYSSFKVNQDYHRLRKSLESDPRYGHVRLLDPGNPKSQKKPFFNPNILQEFDKHYTPKQTLAAHRAHNQTARSDRA